MGGIMEEVLRTIRISLQERVRKVGLWGVAEGIKLFRQMHRRGFRCFQVE